jgi:hypothetical protein
MSFWQPARWADHAPASPLVLALQHARSLRGSEARVTRLRGQLGTLAPQLAPPTSAAFTAAHGAGHVLRWLGLAGLVAVAAIAALSAAPASQHTQPAPAARALPASAPSMQAQPAAVSPVDTVTASIEAPDAPPLAAAHATSRGKLKRPTQAAAPLDPAQVGPHAEAELALVLRAQRLLDTNPRAALEALSEHAAQFPHGVFAQERDSLSIDALRKLGSRTQAIAQARAFLQAYPRSAHVHRIALWLQDTGANASTIDGSDHKIAAPALPTP